MKVSELIEKLKEFDPDAPVALVAHSDWEELTNEKIEISDWSYWSPSDGKKPGRWVSDSKNTVFLG